MSLFLWIAGFILFAFATTFLLKKFTSAETHYVVSIIKSTRFLPLLEKPLFLGKWIERLAKLGLILGFGAIAVDCLFMQKKGKPLRIAAFIASTILLTIFFNIFLAFFFQNPFVEEYFWMIGLAFGVMGFAGSVLVSLATYALFVIKALLSGEQACPGVAPLIPGVEIPNVPLVVPLHGWISLLLILVIHEASHGTVARLFKVKIKSAGLLLLSILPIGAFVEPDEKQLNSIPEEKQAMVYAAGPTANLLTMLASLALVVLFIFTIYIPFIQPWEQTEHERVLDSIIVSEVQETVKLCEREYESPAFGKIEVGWKLEKANDLNVLASERVILKAEEENLLIFSDSEGNEKQVSLTPNELGALGFGVERTKKAGVDYSEEFKTYSSIAGFIASFLNWFIILNLLLALVNFLPTEPFDGGKIAKIVLLPYFGWLNISREDTKKLIGRLFSWIILLLLILNALPLFF